MKQIILMADVIDSQHKNQSKLGTQLSSLVEMINNTYIEKILSPLTVTLGDEFQAVIKDVNYAIDIIIAIEEYFIHSKDLDFKLRYVLLEGDIDTPINHKIAYGMLGQGLTQARNLLNSSKKDNARFLVQLSHERWTTILTNAFIIYQSIVDKWKNSADYEIVSNFIISTDYKDVALRTGKNPSQMWKRKKSLNMESYYAIKSIIHLVTDL